MDFSFLSQNIAPLLAEPSKKQIASKPSKFKRWLKATDKYVYARVPKLQTVITPSGYELNRLRLQIYLSDKEPEQLIKEALRTDSPYLFRRKPDLVLTTFKTDLTPKSKEVELRNTDDFFLYCYYASKFSEMFENELPGIVKQVQQAKVATKK